MNASPQKKPAPTLLAALACLVATTTQAAGPAKPIAMPDFTNGDAIPAGAAHDWNLGATGARGWMFSDKMVTSDARQIRITKVHPDSPADRVLEVGDVILGVAGTPFEQDPRTEFGRALTMSEAGGKGRLPLIRWRDGRKENVFLKMPVLGGYSPTAPYRCAKSERILELGCERIAENIKNSIGKPNPITRSLNALALLASGNRDYLPLVKKEAQWAAGYSTDGFKTWYYGYVITLLAEYTMATGDDSVVAGMQRLALEAAEGQSTVGSWGHRFAGDDGRLVGYGMMNSPGIPLTISLVLAQKAGVDDPAVAQAIDRSAKLLRFYAGKGAVPYGDHHPWIQTHEDNGKCGMAAVLFNLLGERDTATFFTRMALASHGAERDTGHTGNFFNILWSLPAVAQSGPHATGAWMDEFGARYFDLARRHDSSFAHLGPPQTKDDSYAKWDTTGAFMLAYALPLKKLYLTGRAENVVPQLDRPAADRIVADGHGWSNKDRNSTYDALTTDDLIGRLRSWSPVVRERAAEALGRRKDNVTPQLVSMLEEPGLYPRYGACQAIKHQRGRAAEAVGSLRQNLGTNDLWLRVLAADALAGIGDPARVAIPDMLARLATSDPENDPRNMQQRYFAFALFNSRGGLLGRSLDGVDHEMLFTAVRAGLQNQDGRARSAFSSVYKNLTFAQLEPLLPSIHRAIAQPSPSGIMFADGIRTAGLELFTTHHVSEGIELLAKYARKQKKHGSEKRIVTVMKMLESYGTHASRVIPHLEATAKYFTSDETGFPRRLSLDKAKVVRDTIETIEASTDTPELRELNF
ncbi:MAG: DUF6288 domain-containing protein [Verrucomicrobiales bacterium]|nr:DUF6288 domain-containing protein [Verrucomicrobiales bacterium]